MLKLTEDAVAGLTAEMLPTLKSIDILHQKLMPERPAPFLDRIDPYEPPDPPEPTDPDYTLIGKPCTDPEHTRWTISTLALNGQTLREGQGATLQEAYVDWHHYTIEDIPF